MAGIQALPRPAFSTLTDIDNDAPDKNKLRDGLGSALSDLDIDKKLRDGVGGTLSDSDSYDSEEQQTPFQRACERYRKWERKCNGRDDEDGDKDGPNQARDKAGDKDGPNRALLERMHDDKAKAEAGDGDGPNQGGDGDKDGPNRAMLKRMQWVDDEYDGYDGYDGKQARDTELALYQREIYREEEERWWSREADRANDPVQYDSYEAYLEATERHERWWRGCQREYRRDNGGDGDVDDDNDADNDSDGPLSPTVYRLDVNPDVELAIHLQLEAGLALLPREPREAD